MTKVTYTPTDPLDSQAVTVFGETFKAGEARDLETVHPKLRTNPQFVVEEDGPAKRATKE